MNNRLLISNNSVISKCDLNDWRLKLIIGAVGVIVYVIWYANKIEPIHESISAVGLPSTNRLTPYSNFILARN